LPLKAYRKNGEERQPMPSLPRLFADLEAQGTLVPWLCQGFSSIVLRGNAVGLIISTDGMGFPTVIEWVSMDRVTVDDSSGVGRWFIDGRSVSRMDIVHIPWVTIPGRTLGLSPIEAYASTILAGTSAQAYGNDWFAGGGFPPSVFKNTQKTIDAEAAASIRARLVQSIRRREPLVTGNDWDYTPITIPPEQAQFIESQKLSATQVANIYGIDPTEIGGEAASTLNYVTEETRQIRRAADARPYLTRFERAAASWLPERQYVKFTTDATVRADLKTRWEVHQIRHAMGATSIDEIRATEDEPPLPDGQGQTYGPAPAPAPEPTPVTPPRLSAVPSERKGNSE
jgi:HK97 family phage portal protein